MIDHKADNPNNALEQLIQLLQSGEQTSASDELLAELSEPERREFLEVQQALRLLNDVRPCDDRAAIESASMQHDATPRVNTSQSTLKSTAPETLGSYEVLETIATGGFGIVVKARDTRLGRLVALKIPRIESLLSGADGQKRFAQEARLVAMLGHPAIVPVYETGSDGSTLFIASAYCNGGTLGRWFRDRNQSIRPSLAAKIVARLAEAAQHAHVRGVIHRDLKPGNVLLQFDDKGPADDDDTIVDALRITDFGLAKFTSSDQNMTKTGATIGTPAYMSPEQARGAVDEIGVASDIYALGAILYELLVGRPPIVGQSNMATMRAIETQTPASPRQINSAVPRDLEAICLKCLEKSPLHRYETVQQLEDDLRRLLRGQTVNARSVGPMTRFVRWGRRNPIVATAVTVAFASMALGLTFSIAYGVRAERDSKLAIEKQSLADEKSKEALVQAKLARGAVDRLHRAIADEPKFKSEGMETFKLNLAKAATDYYQMIIMQQPNDLEVLREYVDTLKGLAYMLQLVGNHADAAKIWAQAAEIVSDRFPDDLLGWAAIRSKLAEDKLLVGKTHDAIEITNDLVSRLEQAALETGSDDVLKNLVFQLVNAAQNLNHQGSANQAEPLVDQAIELVSLLTGTKPEQWPAKRIWARVLRCKSETAIQLENHEEVARFAPLAIELYKQIMTDNPARTSEALDSLVSMHQNLGTSKCRQSLYAQAFVEFEQEKQLMQQLMQRHPDVAGLSFNWSNHIHQYTQALFEAGRFDEADQMMASHLPWLEARLQKYPQLIHLLRISEVECRAVMSEINAQHGRREASAQQLTRAIEVCEEECQSEQAPSGLRAILGKLYTSKAERMLESDKTEAAVVLLNQASDILQPIVAENPSGDPAIFLRHTESLLNEATQRK